MSESEGFFDDIFLTESTFRRIRMDGPTLRIRASGIFLLADHPLINRGDGPHYGDLIFEDVVYSRRKTIEYIGDPKMPTGFGPSSEVSDACMHNFKGEGLQEFAFEGFQESPPAWIEDWVVRARSFKLILYDSLEELNRFPLR